MADTEDGCVEGGKPPQRRVMLFLVQVERMPAGTELRPGHVLGDPEPEPELERDQFQRLLRQDADGLCAALARDDVRFPPVGVNGRVTCLLERGKPAEVGAVAVREGDRFKSLAFRPRL